MNRINEDTEYAVNWSEVENQVRVNKEMAVWEPESENRELAYPHFDLAPYIYKRRKNKFSISKFFTSFILMALFLTTMFLALDSGIKRCEKRGYTFEQCIK